jgi:hypothetical protein
MKLKITFFFVVIIFNSFAGALSTMVIPAAERTIRLLIVGGDAVMIAMALSAVWPRRSFYGVRYLIAFLLVSTLTFIYNLDRFGFPEHLNGIRESLFFFASLVVVYDLYESPHRLMFIRVFSRFLIVLAIAQIPVAFLQFLKYGAGDLVGGTYGTAGGSGYLSQLLFLVTFYFVVRYASLGDGTHFSATRMLLFLPALIPCAINETKISFLLLAVFLILMISSPRKIYRAVPLLILGAAMLFLLNYYYTETVADAQGIFDQDYIEKYLLTNPTERGGDLPRFQRVIIMFRMMGDDVGSILLGMGYGVLGGGNIMNVSRLGRTLYYLVTGSRILLFRVWIQGGALAVIIVAGAMFGYLRSRAESYFTLRQLGWFLAFSMLVIWVYDEAIFDRVYAPIAAFLMIWIRGGGILGEQEPSETGSIEDDDRT